MGTIHVLGNVQLKVLKMTFKFENNFVCKSLKLLAEFWLVGVDWKSPTNQNFTKILFKNDLTQSFQLFKSGVHQLITWNGS